MSRAIRITLLLLVLAGAGAGGWFAWKWMHRPWRPMSPALIEPRLALAVLSGPSLYANAAGLAWREREKRALLPAPVHRARLPQATQDPQLFRELDRELRFAEVWLVGLLPQTVEVFRAPSEDGYGEKRTARRGDVLTAVNLPGVSIDVAEILG